MGLVRTFIGHTAPVHSAVFLPDDRFILSASRDRTVKLWDRQREDAVRTTEFLAPLTALALSHEGLTVVGDETGAVTLWNVTTGEVLGVIGGMVGGGVRSLAARSADGLVVAGGELGSLAIFQGTSSLAQRTILLAHAGSTNAVVLHPQHDVILSGGSDMQIKMWGTTADTPLHQFETRIPEQGAIFSLAISHDGRLALSGGHPRIKLWQVTSSLVDSDTIFAARELGSLGTSGDISAVAFSNDSRFALSAEAGRGTVSLRKVDPDHPEENLVMAFEGHEGRIHSVAFSGDNRFAVSTSEDSTLRLWDLSAAT